MVASLLPRTLITSRCPSSSRRFCRLFNTTCKLTARVVPRRTSPPRIPSHNLPPPTSSKLPISIPSTPATTAVHAAPKTLKPTNQDAAVLPQSKLSYHWDTVRPSAQQLVHADTFFKRQPPQFLYSAEKFLTMSFGVSPEVCFLGRSNVGKSSLLNALAGKPLAHASARRGRTRTMNAFAVGGLDEYGKETLVVLDMPGYGKGAKAEWGKEIVKYLSKRKQLVRAFLLVDSEHGVKDTDRRILELFRENQVPFQIVLSKVDKIVGARRGGRGAKGQREDEDGGGEGNEQYAALLKRIHEVKDIIQPDMEEDGEVVGEIIACSSGEPKGKKLNIAALRFAVLKAAGLELQEKEIVDVSTGEEIVSFEEIARMSRSTKEGGSKDVDVG